MLNATMPNIEILRIYYPEVKLAADLKVQWPPHVHVKQILDAPTTANKLGSEKNLWALRRYILQRWHECGRQLTLVIAPMKVDEWLTGKLPSNFAVRHHNDYAGLDIYGGVRLLIMVGRPLPGPEAPEALAGALSGLQPEKICQPDTRGIVWYDRPERGIRLRNGTGVAARTEVPPDPFVEAVRWQICEGQLLQGIGRSRAINRTADTPARYRFVARSLFADHR